MPYKLSTDGKAVLVWKNGKWIEKKRYRSKKQARALLAALKIHVKES